MRTSFIAACLLPILAAGCANPTPEEIGENTESPGSVLPAPRRERVGCIITGEQTCEVGKKPKINVKLINQTDSDMYLVGSLGDSHRKARLPFCYFEVTLPDGKQIEDFGFVGCGRVNTLKANDFVKVQAGGMFYPDQPNGHDAFASPVLYADFFRESGTYRLRFVYSTKSDDLEDWLFEGREEREHLLTLLKQVPQVEVKSEEFLLTVFDPNERAGN